MRITTFILALAAACGFAQNGDAFVRITSSAKPQAAARADIQDLVFCSEQGLCKLRLYVSVNGRSASANWGEFVNKAFDYCDRNRDGFLDTKEITPIRRGRPAVDADVKAQLVEALLGAEDEVLHVGARHGRLRLSGFRLAEDRDETWRRSR